MTVYEKRVICHDIVREYYKEINAMDLMPFFKKEVKEWTDCIVVSRYNHFMTSEQFDNARRIVGVSA